MLFLILAILGGSMLSIMMRMSEGRVSSKISMLAVNYITCMLLCAVYMDFNLAIGSEGSGFTLGLGMITGVFYVVSLLLMQLNIRKNGVILPSVFSRLGGLLVPLAVAICFFDESPTILQIIGAVIAGGAMIAINAGPEKTSDASILPLLALLLSDGFATTMSTIYEKLGASELNTQFLFYTFATALLICIVLILKNKERLGWPEILFGLSIGIPNFYASRCLLQALENIPAVIAYPTRGVACIVVVSLAGILLFREHLHKRQWAAIGAILIAVALLNI
ncbi:MAG: EamA family transporter [Clostridia bacterium]|nr:EamA family transporter [Clostridia bacterium]